MRWDPKFGPDNDINVWSGVQHSWPAHPSWLCLRAACRQVSVSVTAIDLRSARSETCLQPQGWGVWGGAVFIALFMVVFTLGSWLCLVSESLGSIGFDIPSHSGLASVQDSRSSSVYWFVEPVEFCVLNSNWVLGIQAWGIRICLLGAWTLGNAFFA